MKLTIVSASKGLQSSPKVTIYSNGNLSLSKSAVRSLGIRLDKEYHVALAVDEKHKPEQKLFMVFYDKKDEETRKIVSTEASHLINLSGALDNLGLDYKKTRYVYQIAGEHTWNNQRVVELERVKK